MPLPDTVSTVTIGGRVEHPITGAGGTGTVNFTLPSALLTNDGIVLGNHPALTYSLADGQFTAAPVLPANNSPDVVPQDWPYRISVLTDVWQETFYASLPASPSTTTLAALYAQSVSTPPAGVSYIPLNTLGQPGGPASLGEDGILATGQRPPSGASVRPWQIAEQYAGLSDPSVITDYAADPNAGITLAAGTYRDLRFTCTELILPNSNTKLVNCDIVTSNSSYGVRLDANTGMETGRYLEHCRITAGGVALAGAGFTARLCEVVNNSDDSARLGRSHAEPTAFEYCRFHGFRPQAGAHADGIQIVTPPAADVVVYGCSITMDTASGYTMPDGAGYTAALFVDTADVPVDPSDPEPTRIGSIWADGCKLYSSDNYSVVIDGPNVDVRNCTLLPGSTAVESINDGAVVTGTGNVDIDGVPIADTDIHGDPRSRYLTVGDPRQSGGGGGGFTPRVADELITSGSINFPNTSGSWLPVNHADGTTPVELSVTASIGHRIWVGDDGLREAGNAMDYCVMVGSTQQRYLATLTSTPAGDGNVGRYSGGGGYTPVPGRRSFVVTADDLDGGRVRIAMVSKGTGSGRWFAGADDTFYWWAENAGPTD